MALVAPESKILPVRVLDVDGRGDTFALAEAIIWAVDHGHASVINMSLGSDADATVLEESIAYAQSRGVLIVAAAGNDNLDNPQYPAVYPDVLGVTAVDDAGHKADFANYGSGWVDLAAPGVAITSTVPVSGSIYYATWSGTSMAVPFVSGAAALVRQALPDAPPAEVSNQLFQTGRNLDALNPGYEGKLGRLLDIDAALPDIVLPPPPEPTDTYVYTDADVYSDAGTVDAYVCAVTSTPTLMCRWSRLCRQHLYHPHLRRRLRRWRQRAPPTPTCTPTSRRQC